MMNPSDGFGWIFVAFGFFPQNLWKPRWKARYFSTPRSGFQDFTQEQTRNSSKLPENINVKQKKSDFTLECF